MGLDLRLLPFEYEGESFSYSHSILSCERRRDLFEAMMALDDQPVGTKFQSFTALLDSGESGYGTTTETPYGEPLTYVLVKDLLPFAGHEGVRDDYTNRAIWAYLKELPPKTKVALYWH